MGRGRDLVPLTRELGSIRQPAGDWSGGAPVRRGRTPSRAGRAGPAGTRFGAEAVPGAHCDGTRASGGIGRRARFRSVCPKGRGGSTPPSRTTSRSSRPDHPAGSFVVVGAASDQRDVSAPGQWGGGRNCLPRARIVTPSWGTSAPDTRSTEAARQRPGCRRLRNDDRGAPHRLHARHMYGFSNPFVDPDSWSLRHLRRRRPVVATVHMSTGPTPFASRSPRSMAWGARLPDLPPTGSPWGASAHMGRQASCSVARDGGVPSFCPRDVEEGNSVSS